MVPASDPKESSPPPPIAPATAKAPESDPKKESAEVTPPLTPEEQMARFEAELKEQDWGHQPC
jgi:hypothetical protein